MAESDTNPRAFLLQTARCGVFCLAPLQPGDLLCLYVDPAGHKETQRGKGHYLYKKPNSSSFQALPTFKGLCSRSQRRVTDRVFRWPEAGGGQGVRWDGDGGLREAETPLDKLELQTVETCEIRMEPSLLHCDLKDRARSSSLSAAQLPRRTLDHAPLCCSGLLFFVQIEKHKGTVRNDWRDGLCTWKCKTEVLW